MKKIWIVSLFSFIFLIISSLIAYFTKYLPIENKWIYLINGFVILIISGIVSGINAFNEMKSKKYTIINLTCFILSAIALGFMIRCWYIYRNFDNSILTMCFVSLTSVTYLWIFYLLLYIPFIEKHLNIYVWIYFLLSAIAYILVVVLTNTTYVSTFGYYMIIEIAFIFALCKDAVNLKELIRNIIISTYSVFIVGIIMVLLMIGGDGFDIGYGGEDFEFSSPKDKKLNDKYII